MSFFCKVTYWGELRFLMGKCPSMTSNTLISMTDSSHPSTGQENNATFINNMGSQRTIIVMPAAEDISEMKYLMRASAFFAPRKEIYLCSPLPCLHKNTMRHVHWKVFNDLCIYVILKRNVICRGGLVISLAAGTWTTNQQCAVDGQYYQVDFESFLQSFSFCLVGGWGVGGAFLGNLQLNRLALTSGLNK